MQVKKMAQKWDHEEKQYHEYVLPEGATLNTDDMDKKVNCADCGKGMLFGEGYTSREIHTEIGMGYCVCGDCYYKK